MKTKDIVSHTGIRGIAATAVFLGHIYSHKKIEWILNLNYFRLFAWEGYAVDLFFILSGFILHYVYIQSQYKIVWRQYFIARIARICPLYYVTMIPGIISTLILCGHFTPRYVIYILCNILFASGFLGLNAINLPAWSLSVEMLMYLALFPILYTIQKNVFCNKKAPMILLYILLFLGFLFLAEEHLNENIYLEKCLFQLYATPQRNKWIYARVYYL